MTASVTGRAITWTRTCAMLCGIAVVLGTMSDAGAQKDPRLKIRKTIERLEKQQDRLKLKLQGEEEKIAKAKERLAKKFLELWEKDSQNAIGTEIANVMSASTNGTGIDEATALPALEKAMKSTLGRHIYESAKKDFAEMVAILKDEGNKTTPARAARGFRDAMESCFSGRDFQTAWDKKLKLVVEAKATELRDEIDDLGQRIESARRSLISDIKGNIPRGMVPVPGVTAAKLGVTTKEIEKLSKENADSVERNIMLFLGSQTERRTEKAFLIDQNEVTHLEYWYFCQQTGRAGPKDKKGNEIWIDGKVPAKWERRPITHISLDDAQEYAQWVGARIPTEYEWEIAARSGKNGFDGRFWAFGNQYEKFMCNDNLAHDMRERRTMSLLIPKGVDLAAVLPVGTFKDGSSPLGLNDMNGNVAEWTLSPFAPRPTFKDVKFGKSHVSKSQFDDEQVVVRGGHCDMRNMIATNVMRIGVHPQMKTKYIGFRCARSATPGRDLYTYLTRNSKLDSRLSDFKKTDSEIKQGRDFPELDQDNERFAILEKLEWNEELGVRGEAKSIFLANRLLTEMRTEKDLKKFTTSEVDGHDNALLLGIFHTDVPILKPALAPGTWFVAYMGPNKIKDPETKKTKRTKAQFLFFPQRPDKPIGVLPVTGSAALVSKGRLPTKLEASSSKKNDRLTLVFSYGIRVKSNATLQIAIDVEVAKDALKDYF